MFIEKTRLIKSQGHSVKIRDTNNGVTETKALIGRASAQFNSMISLESHRKAFFLPDIQIGAGYKVMCDSSDEQFIIVAVYPELVRDKKISSICHMLVCNAKLKLTKDAKTADTNGNIKVTPEVVFTDVDVYILRTVIK